MLKDHTEVVELPGSLLDQRAAAFYIDFGGKGKMWVPKSMCEWSRSGYFLVAKFMAKDKGLIK